MNEMNNKVFRKINSIFDFMLLNILWVLACIPIVTIFPATAAMFGVVRKKALKKEINGMCRLFFDLFKENFRVSFVLFTIWMGIVIFIYIDYIFLEIQTPLFQLGFKIVLFIGALLFLAISMYIFPIMVHFDLNWRYVLRNSVFLALMNPIITIIAILIFTINIYLVYIFPVSIFFISSFTSFSIYYLCQFIFNQLPSLKETN
jgi:uncharacterized membrane protein YesL